MSIGSRSRPRVAGAAGQDVFDLLLIEDDPGDVLLVEEYLEESDLNVRMTVARSLGDARRLLTPDADPARCILVDLSLPDASGLELLSEVLTRAPRSAVLVLTGLQDVQVAASAVAAGAQDYLVKQEVEAPLLARAIRYAIERKRADETERQLFEERFLSEENARLERGLLPVPILSDPDLRHHARYQPGRQWTLLGGDFHDTVQTPDGRVHVVIGDVSGHGADEASLGVRLRIAWRTLVLAGHSGERVLTTLDAVLTAERWADYIFTTLCMITIDASRRRARMFRAGHPQPLLVRGSQVEALPDDRCGPALGLIPDAEWQTTEIELGETWSLMLYTDGLIEGYAGENGARLDLEGLVELAGRAVADGHTGAELIDHLVSEVETLNGGVLTDDLAVLLLTWDGPGAAPRVPALPGAPGH
ncbi:PP2C family protein-serine/threonine phosphatase [Actinomadura scrupuli]|uniref:PP2C family protein-serine/threonine phosphatase n=1 Tax=Actinomadura scrupuli TaxID=559629 RepID=UPI003D99E1DD